MPYKEFPVKVTSKCPAVRVSGNNVDIDAYHLVNTRYIGYLFDVECNVDYSTFPERTHIYDVAQLILKSVSATSYKEESIFVRVYNGDGSDDTGTQSFSFSQNHEETLTVFGCKAGRNLYHIYFAVADNLNNFRDYKGGNYKFNISLKVDYFIAPLEKPTSLSPSNSTINPKIANRFSWDSSIDPDGYRFAYSVNNGNEVSFDDFSRRKYYIMPANTIKADTGTIKWNVKAIKKSKDTGKYEYSKATYAEATLGAVDQKAPILTYPVGDYVKNDGNIVLKWDFITNTTEEQASAEIKYKLGANSWRTVTVGSKTEYKLSSIKSTFNDSVYWQVRVKNQFDQWSEWSDVEQFQVIGIPPIPTIISVSNQNKPLTKWQSENQEAFSINVLQGGKSIYDSGIIVSAVRKEYRIDEWLKNGKYTIALKIYSKYGVTSPVATSTIEIKPDIKITNPSIRIFDIRYGILIRSSADSGEVYRDGVFIGNLKNGEYKDYTGTNGKNSMYHVRATEDYSFADSKEAQGITNLLGASTIATLDNPEDFVLLEYNLDADPKRNLSLEIESKEIALNNRKYNFTEYGIKEKETLTVNYLVDEIKKLKKLLQERKTLIYRDSYGFIIEGTISDINSELTIFGYQVSFTITKIGDKYE